MLRLLILWVIGMTALGGCADKLLLFPSREPITTAGRPIMIDTPKGRVELLAIRSDGLPATGGDLVHGKISLHPPAPEAYVLGFTGNGSRAEIECDKFVSYFSRHTVVLYVMNYPGFGESEGSAKVAAIPPAALAAYDYVAAQAHGKPIFVMGHSLGSAVALYVARERPVAGLILHNPPPLHELIMGRFGWWNGWIAASLVARAVPDSLESIPNAKAMRIPAVLLLAGRDTLVTPHYQQLVADAYAGPKELIRLPAYGHNDPVDDNDLPRVWDAVEWMWRHSAAAATQPATQP